MKCKTLTETSIIDELDEPNYLYMKPPLINIMISLLQNNISYKLKGYGDILTKAISFTESNLSKQQKVLEKINLRSSPSSLQFSPFPQVYSFPQFGNGYNHRSYSPWPPKADKMCQDVKTRSTDSSARLGASKNESSFFYG